LPPRGKKISHCLTSNTCFVARFRLKPLLSLIINHLIYLTFASHFRSIASSSIFSTSVTSRTPRTRPDRKRKMEAPLSSPSLNGPSHNQPSYFAQAPTSSSASSGPTSVPQQKQPAAQAPPSQQRTDTSPFLRDFNLVAEAAKRAQMAVLMRDMEGVAISS